MKNTITKLKQSSILIRIPERDKIEVVQILDELGITLTQSFYMFIKSIINKRGIPFNLNVNDGLWKRMEKVQAVNKIFESFDPKSVDNYDIKNEQQLQKYITEQRRKGWK